MLHSTQYNRAASESPGRGRSVQRGGARDGRSPSVDSRGRETHVNQNFEVKHVWRLGRTMTDADMNEARDKDFVKTHMERFGPCDRCFYAESSRRNHTIVVLQSQDEEDQFDEEVRIRDSTQHTYTILQYHRYGEPYKGQFELEGRYKAIVKIGHRGGLVNHLTRPTILNEY